MEHFPLNRVDDFIKVLYVRFFVIPFGVVNLQPINRPHTEKENIDASIEVHLENQSEHQLFTYKLIMCEHFFAPVLEIKLIGFVCRRLDPSCIVGMSGCQPYRHFRSLN